MFDTARSRHFSMSTRPVAPAPAPTFVEDPDVTEDDDDGQAHLFAKPDILYSTVTGKPVKALCGYVKVITRNADDLPACQPCSAALARLGVASRGMN